MYAVLHNYSRIFKTIFYGDLNLVWVLLDQKIVLSGLHVHGGLQQLKIWKSGIGMGGGRVMTFHSTAVWY